MAMEAKAEFLNEMEKELGSVLTYNDMTKTLSIIADKLSMYDVEATEQTDNCQDDLLDAYAAALSVRCMSEKTIERYKYVIGKMLNAVKVPTRNITVYHLRSYLAQEKTRGISDRTLEGNRQTICAYFNWLQREGLVQHNPAANLGSIKYQKKEKDVYDEADIERMKFGCKNIRDRAIVCFLSATGCRISEMCGLDRKDVDIADMECTVLGKGNKVRIVFLDRVAAMTLQAYLDTRSDDEPALFVGKGSTRMTPGGVRKMLRQLGEDAHVKHVHPHKFRRTAATTFIRHGMPIQEVATILGHEKLDTTMQYVVLDKSDIKNAYRKYA